MNTKKIACVGLLFTAFTAASMAERYDLSDLLNNGKLTVFNRTAEAASDEAIALSSGGGDGIAWLPLDSFSNGTIEVEVKGKNQSGRSFLGVAFHGASDTEFDAVYLRPFNFQSPQRRANSAQYISMPRHDWRALRESFPGKYEASIDPAPEPELWVKLTVVVQAKKLQAFVNGAEAPTLEVDLISERGEGKVGLWVGNGSDGEFRNLVIRQKADSTTKTSQDAL